MVRAAGQAAPGRTVSYEIPLLVSAAVFAAFIVFKVRPHFGGDGRTRSHALKDAKARVATAPDEPARAAALADAGDACASLGRFGECASFYQRALRTDPTSASLVARLAAALTSRPRLLESLLWRHLSHGSAEADARAAMVASLEALASLYGRSPRTDTRRRGLEHVTDALRRP